MRMYELMKINECLFRMLERLHVSPRDLCYVPMTEEFLRMRGHYKMTYIVSHLATKYHLSVRGVQKILKRMTSEIKV